jgi:hypothetical protein
LEALRCPPRFGTRRSLDRPTIGPAIAKVAAVLDPSKASLPHQRYIYDVIGELDPETGVFAYDDVTVVGPRQVTGKTEFLLPLMAWRCTGLGRNVAEYARREFGVDVDDPPPQRVMYTAQRAEDARQKWRDVHVERIKASPLRADLRAVRLRLAAEQMQWRNGSVWVPGATTGRAAGTGDQLDLGVIDEAWAQTDGSTEIGMRPTMLTRIWRQLVRTSMVPGPERVTPDRWAYLRQKMKAGRARVEADLRAGTAYFEWSADPQLDDPADEDVWWRCMPALGHTVPIRNVRHDFETLNRLDFMAEYLGIWPDGNTPLWQTVAEHTWTELAHGGVYQDPIALGVDATPELTASSIGMAAQVEDGGDIHLELIERRGGIRWLIPAILSLCRSHSVCAVGIDRNGPIAGLVTPLTRAADDNDIDITIVELKSPETSAACAMVYSETGERDDDADGPLTFRRVRHIQQRELTDAVGGVIRKFHGSRFTWDRVGSAVDVSPLNACTWARFAGEQEEWIGDYDIADSLGGARGSADAGDGSERVT